MTGLARSPECRGLGSCIYIGVIFHVVGLAVAMGNECEVGVGSLNMGQA